MSKSHIVELKFTIYLSNKYFHSTLFHCTHPLPSLRSQTNEIDTGKPKPKFRHSSETLGNVTQRQSYESNVTMMLFSGFYHYVLRFVQEMMIVFH